MARKPKEKRGVLVCIAGKSKDEMVKLRRDNTIFGREKADIIVSDAEVSSTHCQIQLIGDIYHIFDMNSSNGTFVNGKKIIKYKLSEGDVIDIGKTSFRFCLEDEKTVRHIPTLLSSAKDKPQSIVNTFIEQEFNKGQRTMMVLKIKYDKGGGETVELAQPVVYIGRASSFGQFDRDPEISRRHLMIKLNVLGTCFPTCYQPFG